MQRARRIEEKEQRRKAFLDAVRTLFERGSFGGITMADVAREAGLAKGTVFLYFPTKEALFLALLEQETNAWFDEIDATLGQTAAPMSAEELAGLVSESLARRVALTRILPLVPDVLEHNVGVERVVAFKLSMAGRLAHTGDLLERRLGLPPGEGVRLLLRTNVLVVGLRNLTAPGPILQEAMRHPDLTHLTVDFKHELHEMLAAFFRARLAAATVPLAAASGA